MASFQIEIEPDVEMSEGDLMVLCNAVRARITKHKYRVAMADGSRHIGVSVDVARWNGDPV